MKNHPYPSTTHFFILLTLLHITTSLKFNINSTITAQFLPNTTLTSINFNLITTQQLNSTLIQLTTTNATKIHKFQLNYNGNLLLNDQILQENVILNNKLLHQINLDIENSSIIINNFNLSLNTSLQSNYDLISVGNGFSGCVNNLTINLLHWNNSELIKIDDNQTVLPVEGCDGVFCSNKTCNNKGKCFDNGIEEYCQCEDGYKGSNCEIPDCSKVKNETCNAGQCAVNETQWFCNCSDLYFGQFCQFFNSCSLCDATNTISCSIDNDNNKNFTCICKDNYLGTFCNETVSTTASTSTNIPSTTTDTTLLDSSMSSMLSNISSTTLNPGGKVDLTGLIVGLSVGFVVAILLIVAGVIIIRIILDRRREHGVYRPNKKETGVNTRSTLHLMLRPPNEERLI